MTTITSRSFVRISSILGDALDCFVAARAHRAVSQSQFRQAQRDIRRFSRLARIHANGGR